MTLLATIYADYTASDFDIETAQDASKRLVITWEQAREWVEAEVFEGRDPSTDWKFEEYTNGNGIRIGWWQTECNEYGTSEEWLLTVEDVPFCTVRDPFLTAK
jgi:hypothetical protein